MGNRKQRTMKKQTCKSCKYFNKWNNSQHGDCFRYPPLLFGVGEHIENKATKNHVDGWCGEYKPNK